MLGKQGKVFFGAVAARWINAALLNGGKLRIICSEPKALSEAFAQQVVYCERRELRDGAVCVGEEGPQRWLLCFERPSHVS